MRDAVHRQRLEALRDRLFEPPADAASWCEAVLFACEALDAGDELALEYAMGHLGAWPPPFRVPPCRCGDGARWLRGLPTEASTRAGRLRQIVANLPEYGGCPVKGWLIGEGWSPGSSWRCLELWCGQALVGAEGGELRGEALGDGVERSHPVAHVHADGRLVIGAAAGEVTLQHRDTIELGGFEWTYWRSPPGTLVFRSRWGMELRRVPMPGAVVTIGRSEAVVDVAVPEVTLSRRHAVVRFAQGQFSVQDIGSTGGTYVGGQRQRGAATPFGPGVPVTMGQVEMELVL